MKRFLLLSLLAPGAWARTIQIPDGWADPGLNLAFVSGPARKVLALDLAKGKTRWTMEAPGFSLGLWDARLYVLVQDHVLAVDPHSGKILKTSQSLGLGVWGILGSTHSHGGQTFYHHESFSPGLLTLDWYAERSHVTGYAGVIKEGEGHGRIRVDLESGAVEKSKAPALTWPSRAPEPDFVSGLERSLPKGSNLARWVSLDGFFVLAREQKPHESVDMNEAAQLSFVCDLYEAPAGKRLGSPKIPLLMKDFAVAGDTVLLLWEQEQIGEFYHRELRALTLKGKKRWTFKLWEPPTYPPVP